MRHSKIISLLLSVVWFFLFLPGLSADSEVPFEENEKQVTISMDLQDVRLKEVLKILSIQSGLNFIASQALQDRTMTLYLDKVPLKQAMDKIFEANNLSYDLDKEANVFIVRDWGIPQTELQTRVYYLKNQAVSSSALGKEMGGADTLGVIKSILSSQGKILEDSRTNSLIITDIPKSFANIEQVIAGLDTVQPQVMLEVEMLDVNKGLTDKMGFNWTSAGSYTMTVASASRVTNFPLSNFIVEGVNQGAALAKTITQGSVSFSSLALVLDFLKTQVDTRSLARPKIMTLNNQTAEINLSTDEAVNSQSTTTFTGGVSTTSTTIERATTGVTLKVTPMINLENGEITMSLYPAEKSATSSSLTGVTAKDIEERSVKSIVKVRDGETIIIGGLIRKQLDQTMTKLPLLGDLPLLGGLFRHKNKTKDKERELLVFITPRIIKENKMKLAQGKPVVIPEREQDIASGVTRQVAISNYLNNLDKKAR